MLEHNIETQSRLLAKLVREALTSERFESLADLTDALKFRCARLKIPYSADAISDAFRLIASNRSLLDRPVTPELGRQPVQSLPLSRVEALSNVPEHLAAASRRRGHK
jgi:hypothetical protein